MGKEKKIKKYEMDMCSGNLFIKMLKFCIPLLLTGVLQLLYNAADLIVVSNFSTAPNALGAVGSTSALINLIVNLFMGLSVGTNVLCARYFAAKDSFGVKKTVQNGVIISFLTGIVIGIFGFFAAEWLLELMSNPIPLAVTYLKIYFIGLPCNLLYNFAAAILRGVGDTKRPLYFLSVAGIINFLLNLFFVIVCKMDVDGVALATIISQAISCILIMLCLMRTKECYKFSFKEMKLYKKDLLEMVRIGLPAGLQSSIFSISNVLIQSTVNTFGTNIGPYIIDGNSAASSLEGFVYTSMNSVYHATLTFTSQNVGASKKDNLFKVLLYGLIIVTIIGVVGGGGMFIFGKYALRIYTSHADAIQVGYIRLHYLCLPYFLCGIMDVMCGAIRGLGYAIMPMIVSLIGACGFRILWILFFFNKVVTFYDLKELNLLYVSYPISWILTFIAHGVCYAIVIKKVKKRMTNQMAPIID